MTRSKPLFLALLLPFGLVAGEDPFGFMPDGGRNLFSVVFTDAASQVRALAQDRSAQDWEKEITAGVSTLDTKQTRTLAAYLAVIAPIEAGNADPATLLPPDGRDLALVNCQSCHALFSGYLMHRRDRTGWLATFASPFHSGISMTDTEKTIFADYSAINMPMQIEDVPPALRF